MASTLGRGFQTAVRQTEQLLDLWLEYATALDDGDEEPGEAAGLQVTTDALWTGIPAAILIVVLERRERC